MRVEIDTTGIIPRQSTKDTLVEFARINQIIACNKEGLGINSEIPDAPHVKVNVSSENGRSVMTYGIVYSQVEYSEFKSVYGLSDGFMIGRPVLAVYHSDPKRLVGLVPLGRNSRISLI